MKPVTQLIATTWTFSGKVNSIVLTITPPTGPHVSSFLVLGDAGVGSRAPSNRRNVRQPSTKATVHASATRTRSVALPPIAASTIQTVSAPNTASRSNPPSGQTIFRRRPVHIQTLLPLGSIRAGSIATDSVLRVATSGMRDTPFDYLQHLVTVPVRLNGQERRFVLDSGIGLDLVRDTVEGVVANGRSFAGRRMSGQEVTSPLGIVSIARVRRDRAAGRRGRTDRPERVPAATR